jgi:hypothetical protein
VGITAGSREVPGRKGFCHVISISYNNNNKLKGKFGSVAMKISKLFTTKDRYTRHATWNTESTAV